MKLPTLANATPMQYVRTTVENAEGDVLASNFTWINSTGSFDYKTMNNLKKVTLTTSKATFTRSGSIITGEVTLQNNSDAPALSIRVKTLNDQGERVLPVYYSDNYISLMPGESQTITFEFDEKYLGSSDPFMAVEGWNIENAEIECGDIPADYILGDVNDDGEVAANDALMALQAATQKITLTETQRKAANVDTDETVTANDSLLILQKSTQKIQKFPRETS